MTVKDICKHVIIRGRVQGVGYRAWASATARKLELRGWVRNVTDGSVEAFFVGSPEAVEDMLRQCCKGSMLAKVTEVVTKDSVADDALPHSFVTLPTAEAHAA